MTDPLGTTAAAVTLVDRFGALGHWIWRRLLRRQPQLRVGRPPHAGLELLPLSFEVSLNAQVPYVSIGFYAVNYSRHRLLLDSARVLQLALGGGPSLDDVPLVGEYDLEPRSSRLIYFRRNLADSEARIAGGNASYPSPSGSVAIVAQAQHGRRSIKYGPYHALVVVGTISGRTSLDGPT